MKLIIKALFISIFLLFFSCNKTKQKEKSTTKIIKKKTEKQKETIYDKMVELKKKNEFSFLNYISKIPKAKLPFVSSDYKYFLIEETNVMLYKKYKLNKVSIVGYPIFFTSDFSFDSIKESKLSEITIFNKPLLKYSIQKFKEHPISDDFFYYLIPIFYFPANNVYIIAYISTIDRGDATNLIIIQTYDKKGNTLDSKWNYISLLQAESNISTHLYYYRSSNISKNYIITENRQNNDPDVPNRTIKWRITNNGIKIIK